MSNLGDLLTLAINVVFVFATVSFVASAATDGLSQTLQWRETLLLRGVKALLNDPLFTGLARDIYNNSLVNPRANGHAMTEAQLKAKPSSIDPSAFAVGLLEVLHIVPTGRPAAPIAAAAADPVASAPQPALARVDQDLAAPDRLANAMANATQIIEARVSDPQARAELVQLATNLIVRHGGDRPAMEASVASWFEIGLAGVTDDYRKRVQLANFVIGFLIALLLDLKPIPVGGFAALLAPPDGARGGGEIARILPIAVDIFEWGVVATSTLFGAQFWFSALKRIVAASQPPTIPQAPDAPGAKAVRSGTTAQPGT